VWVCSYRSWGKTAESKAGGFRIYRRRGQARGEGTGEEGTWVVAAGREADRGTLEREEPERAGCTACGVLKGLEGWQWPRKVLEIGMGRGEC
jgi:hypothetical protein